MNYRRIIAAAAAVALITCSMSSCGKDSGTEPVGGEQSTSSEIKDNTEETTEASEEEETEETDEKETEAKTTKASGEDKTDTTTEAASAADSSAASTDSKSTGAASSSSTTNAASGGSSSGSSGGSSSEKATEAPAAATEAPTEAEPEPEFAAEVTFNGAPTVVKGSNVTIEGNRVIVTAGGKYLFSGSTGDGQICVSTATEEKVKIVLAGVNITCQSGPAVFINEAKKCTVEVLDGTDNYLSDSMKDKVYDGVIFSNDTLRIKGGGRLEVTAGNRHGIASDDDVIFEGGNVTVTSVKSGIYAHDDITINDGNLTVRGGSNGIKSRGSINVNGGVLCVSGGTKEEKSSIYATGVFNYTGGCVYAAGNKVTAPTNTAYPYAVASLSTPGAGGRELGIFINGVQQIGFTPHNDYRCIMVLSPNFGIGAEAGFAFNDNYYAGYNLTDTQNVFNIE
ncbi:MAG: carbohydrate-binding domain-containing protein [Ruminococcus sp.]|nr:carbohydrate-binding domain-containing protein [Ruminococcus sp.]